jgi:hypothetical protein
MGLHDLGACRLGWGAGGCDGDHGDGYKLALVNLRSGIRYIWTNGYIWHPLHPWPLITSACYPFLLSLRFCCPAQVLRRHAHQITVQPHSPDPYMHVALPTGPTTPHFPISRLRRARGIRRRAISCIASFTHHTSATPTPTYTHTTPARRPSAPAHRPPPGPGAPETGLPTPATHVAPPRDNRPTVLEISQRSTSSAPPAPRPWWRAG